MKKVRIQSKVLVFALCVCLVLSLFGCGKKDEAAQSETTASATTADATTTEKKEVVNLKLLWRDEGQATNINKYKDNPVYKKLEEMTSTKIEILGWNAEKFNVQVAGGDLPDLICVDNTQIKTVYDAKYIVDLNPLIEKNKAENLKYGPARIQYAKELLKTDGFYFITPGAAAPDFEPVYNLKNDVGPTVRWDYYKELGMPALNSPTDVLNMLEEMVKKHPTTADGKKTYAIGIMNDWSKGLWGYGNLNLGSDTDNFSYVLDTEIAGNQDIIPEFFGTKNSYYQGAKFMNQAYRKGLVHPDAFTMKQIDFEAAAVKGEVIFNTAVYGFEKANVELMKGANPTAFMAIPLNYGYIYSDLDKRNAAPSYKGIRGQDNKNWAVTTMSQNQDRAIQFLDYCFSEEGSRLLSSGIEGVNWEYVSGKPVLKKETIDMYLAKQEDFNKCGFAGAQSSLGFLVGMNKVVKHTDGEFINLFNVPSAYEQMMDVVQKDYAKEYGVSYPFEAYVKKYKEGKIKFNPDRKTPAMPALSDDNKRIYSKVEDILAKGLPKVTIEPKTDEEFETAFNKLRDELIAAGAMELKKQVEADFIAALAKAKE